MALPRKYGVHVHMFIQKISKTAPAGVPRRMLSNLYTHGVVSVEPELTDRSKSQ